MKNSYKKIFVGLAAGAIIATGSAMLLDTAHAAAQRPVVTQNMPQRGSLNDAAQRLATECNVNAADIVSYCNNGGYFRDASEAAHIAKLSGRSFNDVVNAKTNANNWQQVAEQFGVTREDLQNEHRSMMAARIAADSNINSAAAMQLLQEGYNRKDIEIAARLAAASGKDVHAIMDMKKINNRWTDVAKELGVDASVVKPKKPDRDDGMNYGKHHGHKDKHHDQPWIDPNEELDPGFGYPQRDCPARENSQDR